MQRVKIYAHITRLTSGSYNVPFNNWSMTRSDFRPDADAICEWKYANNIQNSDRVT